MERFSAVIAVALGTRAACDFRLIGAVMPLSRFRGATSVLKPACQSAPDDVDSSAGGTPAGSKETPSRRWPK